MTMRRLLALALLASIVGGIVGCGSPPPPAPTPNPAPVTPSEGSTSTDG